jgi:hypothetical protein
MIIGVNAHQANADVLRLAASLGIWGVRADGNLGDLFPNPDQQSFGRLDALLSTSKGLGLHVYVTLAYAPPWMGPRNTPPPEAEWIRLVKAFGEHLTGTVQYIGIWNEPNIHGMYAGSLERYLHELLQPAADTLRRIDPQFQICGPDLSTEGPWRPWFRTLLERGRQWLDVVTVHAYGTPGRAVRDRLIDVRQVMSQAGASTRPLALTEFGWNTARISEELQANYYDQFFEAMQSNNWLSAALGFNLINESTQVQWGLFRDNGTPKPAAEVFRRYAAMAGPNV